MTTRESYIFGWVFGRINAESPKNPVGGDTTLAAQRPYSALAKVMQQGFARGLTAAIEPEIGRALCEINNIDYQTAGGSEAVQPLDMQASWQLGYYAGLYKRPLPSQSFDIGAARKAKKMTQTQLAELMGVDQAHISRWERGEITPTPENLAALKKILLD